LSKKLLLLFSADICSLNNELQEQLYNEFFRLVYPMVMFILNDHAATEDIIQESFLRAIRKPPKYVQEDKIEGWLKTLTRNVTYNYLRKYKKTRDELAAGSVFIDGELSSKDPVRPVDQEVEAKIMKDSIRIYIHKLKPEYRIILEMKWFGELSYREMAEQLGVTEGVVRQRLSRAKEAIRDKIYEDWRGSL